MEEPRLRRAAFDVGSGATKLLVAEVAKGRLAETLFAREVPVAFALDWKRSGEKSCLSAEIQERGLAVLGELLAECERLGVAASARCAVATEVFRKAANGEEYLRRVKEELGLEVRLVPQDLEAALGFRTALALQEGTEEEVVCWDSGGASFQITAKGEPLKSYVGTLGTGNTTAMLIQEVQGQSLQERQTPNPVERKEADALVALLQRQLAEPAAWLKGARVTAIGGPNAMFAVAAQALEATAYSAADVARALDGVLGLSDEELALRPFCQGEDREPPGFIVPKLCLLLAVMEHCGMETVRFCPAVGSCPGLLVTEEMFQ